MGKLSLTAALTVVLVVGAVAPAGATAPTTSTTVKAAVNESFPMAPPPYGRLPRVRTVATKPARPLNTLPLRPTPPARRPARPPPSLRCRQRRRCRDRLLHDQSGLRSTDATER